MTDEPGDTQRHMRPGYRPTPRPGPDLGGPKPGNPWEQRAWLGLWRGLWQAVQLFVTRPVQGFGMTRKGGPWRDPLLFAVAVILLVGTLGGLVESLVDWAPSWSGGPRPDDPFPFGLSVGDRNLDWIPLSLTSIGGCLIGLLVGLPLGGLFLTLFLFIGSSILHLCLAVVGGLKHSTAGFRGSFQVVCYGSVALCAYPIPWVGTWIYLVWGIALQALGFSVIHETGRRRALLAAVLPILALTLLGLSLWALESLPLPAAR